MELAPTHTSRRVNKLARHIKAERYLEIGIAQGATLYHVDVSEKIGVDPVHNLDVKRMEDAGTVLHKLTSDAFFSEYDGPGFDIIFLDGLHEFEQTFRDLCSALDVLNPGGCILIDDTVPNSIYSANRSREDALRWRRYHNVPGTGWHGDVYKTVFALHDLMLRCDYRTFDSGGNSQTLVWHRPRPDITPVCSTFEQISRLDYFAVLDHEEIFQKMPEDELVRLFVRDVQSASQP